MPMTAAPPLFPGATLALDAVGTIVNAWLGSLSPIGEAVGDVFGALDLDESTPNAARLQLLLASACGAPAAAWPLLVADAPPLLERRGAGPLITQWQPMLGRNGAIAAVVVFATAGEAVRVEVDDPVERNRICVEALALLDECDGCLRHLLVEPTARHAVHRMFRAVHTIKGATRGTSCVLRSVSDLAHHAEEALDVLRRSDDIAPASAMAQLDLDLRRLRAAIVGARPRGETDDALTELLADVRPALAELRLPLPEHLEVAARAVQRIANAAERANMRALRIQCTAAGNALAMIGEGGVVDPMLAGEVAALDAHVELYAAVYREVSATDAGPSLLVTLASWMDAPEDRSGQFDGLVDVMAGAGVPSLIAAFSNDVDPYAMRRALAVLTDAQAMFEPARPRDDASLRFERAQRDLLAVIDDLPEEVPQIDRALMRSIVQRLVWTPLAVIARRLVRMTRTLGAELGKTVTAEVDLGDLLVAPEIGRVMGEILVHAVRNAADHGIEAPGERTAAGKDPGGTIAVTAREVYGIVHVTVRDDGRGIAAAKIRRSAVANGLLAPDEPATDAELLDLLFAPGFSTSTTVTAVSGRGVGMDVIKSLVEEQGGTVTLASQEGAGTELTFTLPVAPR
jgi:two-component system chemotaxis sensor kinase CheA